MSDAYLPRPRCPECDTEIDENCAECPSCEAALVSCGRCGSIVAEKDFHEDVAMCENCWFDTVNQ